MQQEYFGKLVNTHTAGRSITQVTLEVPLDALIMSLNAYDFNFTFLVLITLFHAWTS